MQLQREWERERQGYMIYGKHRPPQEPGPEQCLGSIMAGAVISLGGIILLWVTWPSPLRVPQPRDLGFLRVMAVACIFIGIGTAIHSVVNGHLYEELRHRYQMRREKLSGQSQTLDQEVEP